MLDLGMRAELCLLSQSIADVWKSLSFFKNKSHLIQMNIRSIGQLYIHTYIWYIYTYHNNKKRTPRQACLTYFKARLSKMLNF